MDRSIATRSNSTTALAPEGIAPMSTAERTRVEALRAATKRTPEGGYSTSGGLVPTAAERERFAALRADLDERLAADGSQEERARIHDRLHGFLMGFAQLRALDGGNAALMVANFVEAVKGVPAEAVHRACRAWNRRRFSWPNYAFPPTPPDLCRAAKEIVTEMRVERHDLHAILIAAPLEQSKPISDVERQEVLAKVAAAPNSLLKAAQEPAPTPPAPEEISAAREASLRDMGAAAVRACDPSTMARLIGRIDARRGISGGGA